MMYVPDYDWRPCDSYAVCKDCCGSGINRRKRKQKCPVCNGSGKNSKQCGVCYKVIEFNVYYGIQTAPILEAICKCKFNNDGTLKK